MLRKNDAGLCHFNSVKVSFVTEKKIKLLKKMRHCHVCVVKLSERDIVSFSSGT